MALCTHYAHCFHNDHNSPPLRVGFDWFIGSEEMFDFGNKMLFTSLKFLN